MYWDLLQKRVNFYTAKAIRAIYNLRSHESLRSFFKETGIVTLPSFYIFEIILYVRISICGVPRDIKMIIEKIEMFSNKNKTVDNR